MADRYGTDLWTDFGGVTKLRQRQDGIAIKSLREANAFSRSDLSKAFAALPSSLAICPKTIGRWEVGGRVQGAAAVWEAFKALRESRVLPLGNLGAVGVALGQIEKSPENFHQAEENRLQKLFLSNPELLENFALATNWGHEWKPDPQPTDPKRYEDEAMECLMLAVANPLILSPEGKEEKAKGQAISASETPSLVGKEKTEGYLEAVEFGHGEWRPSVQFVEKLFRIACRNA